MFRTFSKVTTKAAVAGLMLVVLTAGIAQAHDRDDYRDERCLNEGGAVAGNAAAQSERRKCQRRAERRYEDDNGYGYNNDRDDRRDRRDRDDRHHDDDRDNRHNGW